MQKTSREKILERLSSVTVPLAVHELNIFGSSENAVASRLTELARAGQVGSRFREGKRFKEWYIIKTGQLKSPAVIFLSLCRENDIATLAVFGSVARGEDKQGSDVDLLVKFNTTKSLFELVNLESRFENIFRGRRIDLVTEGFLSPFIRDSVKKESKVIYGN